MITTTHVLVSALALSRGPTRAHWLAASLGAVVPDLSMFAFYLYQRGLRGRSESLIWTELYYRPEWQAAFDVVNSLPLILLGAGAAYALRHLPAVTFFLSMGLHAIGDFFVHREDAHGHFFPFSDWRFISPVSYWDPNHHGLLFTAFELAIVVGGAVWLARRGPEWRRLGLACLSLHVLFGIFVALTWEPYD
ncbi:MAG: hypothetical protein AAGC67_05160 [Myxococcota bacterium]